ncbi:hypothetical protein F0562_006683 [Nyssa sinensis]|uniref:Uncharacterized protein n=1 Tax=Nyssa sinensis TaxID=561372 RepID=A0A5J5AM58_9ASTE|nr:hypothetical protein F0562_006683 [Nyssa sinensis]
MAKTSTSLFRRRGKGVAILGQRGRAFAQALGENDPPLPYIKDALRMAWDLSWDKILRELAQALHIMAALEVVDSELAEVSIGPELVATVAGLKRVVGAVDSDLATVVGLVVVVVESMRLKLADFELSSPWFGSNSQFAEPWYLFFDQLCLDKADVQQPRLGAGASAQTGTGFLGRKFQPFGCLIDFIEEEDFVEFPQKAKN